MYTVLYDYMRAIRYSIIKYST